MELCIMKKAVFDYLDYKSYINERINDSPSKGRGLKLKIAEFLNCQTAFISQVLNGTPNFSLEQGVKLNSFFEHTREEARFFLLLLQLGRAGSVELQDFFKTEAKEILEKRSDLKNRLDIKNSLKKVDQQIYYSSWPYACIHMMVAIPEFQNPQAIARHLNLPREKVLEVLVFLESTGIIERKGSHYQIGVTKIHLEKESPQIQRHHTNWRMQAIRSIDINNSADLHYSTVVSMSRADVSRIKEILIKSIEESRAVIRDSKEEKIQSICIDFFGV
jgi:uncharacterized protein (TIGR02147 family)